MRTRRHSGVVLHAPMKAAIPCVVAVVLLCSSMAEAAQQPVHRTTGTHSQRVSSAAATEAQLKLTREYLETGRTTAALQLASKLSAAHVDDAAVHFTLGMLLASAKKYRAAQHELELAQALQPDSFDALFNLGQIYFRNREYPKAELVLNRAVKLRSDSPDALGSLAQVYSNQMRPLDAIDLLLRAYKLAPQNTDVILHLARASMSQKYYQDAIIILETGLKIAPQRADLQAALGESCFLSGKVERAIEEFRTLIQLDPSARSYASMGISYRHLGRFDEARKYFQEGLKRDPRNAACLFNLGYIEERQGNHAAAEKLFQQVLRSQPDFSEALLEFANLQIANKKFVQAAELLRRYIKLSSDPATGYYKLAMVERSLRQFPAAQRDLNVFQTLSKNSSVEPPIRVEHLFDFINNRSSLSARERTQLDLNQLLEQVQEHPDRPQDLYLLAETYLKLGQIHEAREAIAKLDNIS